MTIFNLYIFDKDCTCLYYREWVRNKEAGISRDEEFKLMYGMIFSIKSLLSRLSHKTSREGFLSYSTSKYKLHYFESATGLVFVLNTDTSVGNLSDELWHLYSKIYVEYVTKNPLLPAGKEIDSELFASNLNSYIQSLPFFKI